jgi:CheY-like chemotaxis protein
MTEQPVILYVEDDAGSRKLMRLMLSGRMALPQVTILEDSKDFMDKALALNPRPEIIFLDIHMEPHTGFEMLEMLRQRPEFSESRIVAMTASVMSEEVNQLKSAGFDGCLAKPIDVDTFPETVARIQNGETVWRITS